MATDEPEAIATRPPDAPGRFQAWLIGLAAAFCLVALSLNAWSWFGPPSWGPRIGCDAPEFDFGSRPASDVIEHRFLLRNTGRKDLVVRDVVMDCKCLTPEVRRCTIAPWYSFALPIQIDLKNQLNGELLRRIVVESNDAATPRLVLTVKGRVTSPARAAR